MEQYREQADQKLLKGLEEVSMIWYYLAVKHMLSYEF